MKGFLYGNVLQSNTRLLPVVGNQGYPQLKTGYFVLTKADAAYWQILFAIF